MSAPPTTPPTTRWYSLRRRLLGLLLGGIAVGWLAALVFTYLDAHDEIDELFDAQMAQVAQTLLALASEYDDDEDIARLESDGHKYQKKFAFQLWDAEGHLLLRSPGAPTIPLTAKDGFSGSDGRDKERWRYYSQWDEEHQLRVQVAENHHVREDLAQQIAGRLLMPALFGLPLLGLWIWFATRRGLAPIGAIARQVAEHAPDHLAPVIPAEAPGEIRPLLDAMNALFARVATVLDNERRFTADAAHELRTPLAAIVAQSDVARRARDTTERDHALEQLAVGARRASHLLEQLLTLARLDPAGGLRLGPVRIDTLVAEVCADHGPAALEKHIALELDASTPATVGANDAMLRVLLRNLLDNALRYTPAGGQVGVAVTPGERGVTLLVSDSGPGIPAVERENALRRFHRLAGQETEGSGLGLSIVARIAELHGARLELADGLGAPGLSVRLSFPKPAS
jgi:two-component system sensor histidine kinase QseC